MWVIATWGLTRAHDSVLCISRASNGTPMLPCVHPFSIIRSRPADRNSTATAELPGPQRTLWATRYCQDITGCAPVVAHPYPQRPGKPAALRPGVLRPVWTVFPSSDDDGRSVTIGLAPRRPSRRSSTPHVRACGRRATPAWPARMARCWTRRGSTGRPLAGAPGPPGGQTLSPEARP